LRFKKRRGQDTRKKEDVAGLFMSPLHAGSGSENILHRNFSHPPHENSATGIKKGLPMLTAENVPAPG
jgi:hypothetical protein